MSARSEFRDSIKPVPYRWYPHDTTERRPEVGDHVGLWHEVWEVIEIRVYEPWDISDEDRAYYSAEYLERNPPFHVILAHVRAGVASDDRNHHLSISLGTARRRGHNTLPVYKEPGHAPVCSRCGDASPCREVMAARATAASMATAAHYEDPLICPACDKPFRGRAKPWWTFETNLYVPFGPPVTFHRRCKPSAEAYERKLYAADPTYVRQLNCDGDVTAHSSTVYSCTAGDACPGSHAWHQCWAMCRCPEHQGQHEHGCHVDAGATRV